VSLPTDVTPLQFGPRGNSRQLVFFRRVPLELFESLREDIAQSIFQGHLGRTAAGGFKPVVEIPYLRTMLAFGLSDAHPDAGGKSEIAPFILARCLLLSIRCDSLPSLALTLVFTGSPRCPSDE
jgi:hypothetical protein